MNEIKISSCARNVMISKPVLNIEIEHWGACSILVKVDDGVYICSCSVRYEEYICKTKYAFFCYSHFKLLHQSKCFRALIDNLTDTSICVMCDNYRETNINLKITWNFFGALFTV